MNKLFILAGLIFLLPLAVSASSFIIIPSSPSYLNGETITLNLSVDPAGSTVYVASLDAKFSPDTLEFVSFALDNSMLTLNQEGYDLVDNLNGSLIKTGGYPGGINSLTSFGTLVLRAKEDGLGTLTVNNSSKLLDANNLNQQTGSPVVSFTISDNLVVPEKEAQINTTTVSGSEQENAEANNAELINNVISAQAAAAGQSGATNNLKSWIFGIFAIIIISAVGYLSKHKRFNKSSKIR